MVPLAGRDARLAARRFVRVLTNHLTGRLVWEGSLVGVKL
jgi:hypothetical protein